MISRVAVTIILGVLTMAKSALAADAPALKCQAIDRNGSVVSYVISRTGGRYEIAKLVDDTKVGSIELPISGGVEGYGGTHLYFRNAGRSGYLLVYSHASSVPGERARALIDINLFQSEHRALNTRGPELGFECSAS